MFPVIYTINQFLTCFAFCLALFLLWSSRPPFVGHMRPKFQLDMGTLMLAFTLFWSYTSFSQFMLIWIGNLPEEIPFYLKRSAGGWWYVSAGLIALHFALPFLLLLFRDIKLHPKRLRVVAMYLLVICAIDVTWWIEPTTVKHTSFPFWLLDVGSILGIGGLFGLVFFWQLAKRPLLPTNETFMLPEGHHHEHH
jgi:magnesium-transporting ATPase (P-type)